MKKMIVRCKHKNKREHLKFYLVEILFLFDALVCILSLGFLTSKVAPKLLFSSFLENED